MSYAYPAPYLLDISIIEKYGTNQTWRPTSDIMQYRIANTNNVNTLNLSSATDTAIFLNYDLQLPVNSTDGIQVLIPTTSNPKQRLEELQHRIMTDLIVNGIPSHIFKGTTTMTFKGKTYTFKFEDLSLLDLARFPSDGHQHADVANVHALELSTTPMYIPATCDGKLTLFVARNRAGNDLFKTFTSAVKEYQTRMRDILTFITEQSDPAKLWKAIYNTDQLGQMIERIKLQ